MSQRSHRPNLLTVAQTNRVPLCVHYNGLELRLFSAPAPGAQLSGEGLVIWGIAFVHPKANVLKASRTISRRKKGTPGYILLLSCVPCSTSPHAEAFKPGYVSALTSSLV